MSEQDGPDKFTNAWWKRQWDEVQVGYRGANHRINKCHAEYEDCWEAIKELRARSEQQFAMLEEAMAEIGQLKESVGLLKRGLQGLRKTVEGEK